MKMGVMVLQIWAQRSGRKGGYEEGGAFTGNKETDNLWLIGIFPSGGKSESNTSSIRDGQLTSSSQQKSSLNQTY